MSIKFIVPKKLPESNIQAEFYLRCKQEGINCLLEYRVKGSRFDAIIYKGEEIICIIEVKNLSKSSLKRRLDGKRQYKQIERYKQYGIPVICIWDASFIEPAIAEVKELLHV